MARGLARMTPEASRWFLAEVAYLAARNPQAAEKVVAEIRRARESLSNYPRSGPAGLIPGTRRYVVAPYVLTIRSRSGVVEIAAIRHGRQSDAYAPRELLHAETDESSLDDPAS